jgi:hypothetical protein
VLRCRMRSGTIVLLPFEDGPRYGRVPWVKPISAELRETAERAQDRWGEAPDLSLRLSRAAEVVESVVGRAGKPPSRGPGCSISKRWRRADRTQTRSDSKRWMMAAPWARLRLREHNNFRAYKLRRYVGQVGSALTQNTKSSFNGAFPGEPPRPCRSLAPLPTLGPPRPFINSGLMA